MPPDTGTRRQNIYPRVLIRNPDNLVHIQILLMAYPGQLIGICNIDIAKSILDNLGHFGSPDTRNSYRSLTEGTVNIFYLFTDNQIIRPYRTIIIQ